ncbi:MAG: peptidase [Paenibacillaceae bacterium]|nr:peptidase [Paenibacillaceae bacterium]
MQLAAGYRYIRRYWLWFAVYAAAAAVCLWLTRANTVPAAYMGTAADPAVFMTPQELEISEVYSAQRNWLFFISYPWEWGIYIIMLFSGWSGRMEKRLKASRLPGFLKLPLYVALVNAIVFAAWLPVRFIGYRLSYNNGISTQGVLSWLRDKAVSFGVETVPLIIAIAVAFWFIRKGGRWWFKLWLLSVPLILFMMVIQPVFVDPLFNRYSRLSDPVLEQQILLLADRADVPADRVYEADMSTKSNAYNAYVNGIGPTLRIVLWDTLLRLEQKEALLIVAHEMGHYVLHHLEWSALGAVASALFMLALGSWLLRRIVRRWGSAWDVGSGAQLSAVPVILLLVSVLGFASLPFSNFVSRQAERAADRYAMELIGSSEGGVAMNQKLAKATYDVVYPPLVVRLFRSTHPSDMERIHEAEVYGRGE